nr:damaged DNA binding 2 [Tanacetum cinerariifolium]
MNGISLGVRFDGCFMHATLRFAHSLYYKVPNVELETGLVRVSKAKELYYMFDVANAYGWLEMYVDRHDMKLSQYLDVADTTIMYGIENVVEYDEESMQTEEDVVQIKHIGTGLTDKVERATQDKAVQGEDNQQQQQGNLVEHDNLETGIYVE